MDRAGFFSARLGLGLRTLGPFGLGLLAFKNWPDRARIGPVRALVNIGLYFESSCTEGQFSSVKMSPKQVFLLKLRKVRKNYDSLGRNGNFWLKNLKNGPI